MSEELLINVPEVQPPALEVARRHYEQAQAAYDAFLAEREGRYDFLSDLGPEYQKLRNNVAGTRYRLEQLERAAAPSPARKHTSLL